MVGVYSLVLGVAGLGFLLDYVSVPVLTGFISATALIIGFGQVGSLVGLSKTPDGLFNIIGDVLKRLPKWDGPTCGIGFSTILVLLALEKVGKKWGSKHFAIKYLASSRAVIVLVIYTLISYLVNRDREDYVWKVSEVDTNGIVTPQAADAALVSKVAGRAIAPLVACALEHLAVGKAFGRKNGYTIDQSQELNYLGVTNIINSFFFSMPVGGAMSRTAVNSECRVRSPLNGLVTAGFIILTLYVFSPALYWLPKSTLAAIIVSNFAQSILGKKIEKKKKKGKGRTNKMIFNVDHGCTPPFRPIITLLALLANFPRRLHRLPSGILGHDLCVGRDRNRCRCRLVGGLVPDPIRICEARRAHRREHADATPAGALWRRQGDDGEHRHAHPGRRGRGALHRLGLLPQRQPGQGHGAREHQPGVPGRAGDEPQRAVVERRIPAAPGAPPRPAQPHPEEHHPLRRRVGLQLRAVDRRHRHHRPRGAEGRHPPAARERRLDPRRGHDPQGGCEVPPRLLASCPRG